MVYAVPHAALGTPQPCHYYGPFGLANNKFLRSNVTSDDLVILSTTLWLGFKLSRFTSVSMTSATPKAFCGRVGSACNCSPAHQKLLHRVPLPHRRARTTACFLSRMQKTLQPRTSLPKGRVSRVTLTIGWPPSDKSTIYFPSPPFGVTISPFL